MSAKGKTKRTPYEVLGVEPTASAEELRRAYRQKAKTLHPDLHPGDAKAEEGFKELSAAWDLLGDPDRRARYDRGEIDETGQETPQRDFYRRYAETGGGEQYHSDAGFEDFVDASDLFSDLFGGRRRSREGGGFAFPGANLHSLLSVDFETAVRGGRQRVTLPGGKTLDIDVPPGAETGQILRLAGQGQPGGNGGPPGDLLLELSVRPHPLFKRQGDDILLDLPISIDEAVMGTEVEVPTVDGRVRLKVPKGGGRESLRLRGKGVRRRDGKRGDQLVRPVIVAPQKTDADLEAALTAWRERSGEDPRKSWKGKA